MDFLRLVVAVLALYLLCSFLKQMVLITWGVLASLLSGRPRNPLFEKGPDEVTPLPILVMDEMPSYYGALGRDRYGRMVFSSPYEDGRMGYFYLDREASEARRLKGKREGEAPRRDGEAPKALGWKGFDANSSAWEVLGVARDASIKEIKAAYRRLITKFHPDRYQNLSADEIAELERDTKLIHAAYAELAKS